MKLYVDLGANRGLTVKQFLLDRPDTDRVYAWEPTPRLAKDLRHAFRHNPRVHVIEACAGTSEDTVEFYTGLKSDQSSTVLRGKQGKYRADYTHPLKVRQLDFLAWWRQHVKPEDDVWMKVDIEGAEYPVLSHWVSRGLPAGNLRELRVEWHAHKFEGLTRELHDEVQGKLRSLGIKWTDWK